MPAEPNRLAVAGGTPAFPQGPPNWPHQNEQIRAALLECFDQGDWGRYHGPFVQRFQQRLAELHDLAFALACCSGTFAVELALRAVKVQPLDEVVLSGYDFPGNFRAIEAIGARPVLVDIDPRTWCLDAAELPAAMTSATRAIVVSHLHGGLADMRSIRQIADAHGVALVEDACQSPGARVQGRVAGSWGDVGVLSFGGSKLLTAGRGGALLTAREEFYQRAKVFAERGNDAFPMSEMQAAVLLPQLDSLPAANEKRTANVRQLTADCQQLVALTPIALPHAGDEASYYKLAWQYNSQSLRGVSRDQFIAAIRGEGVAMDSGFRGFTRRGTKRCRRAGTLNHSQAAADNTLLLHHPILLESAETVRRVAAALHKVVHAWTK